MSVIFCMFEGYKGGEYTPCHIAHWGSTGEEIGEILLRYMVVEVVTPNAGGDAHGNR